MFFKSILILMINFFSINKTYHINDFKWKNRILVVINDLKNNFSIKADSLKQEFDERDLIIVYLNKENAFLNNRKMSKHFSKSVLKKIKNIKRNQHHILIGKDGYIKNSYSSEIKIEKIFHDIDRMPMRKYEMKDSKNNLP